MDHPALVSARQALGDLHRQRQNTRHREALALEDGAQLSPFDQLHRDEGDAVGLVDLVDDCDVWVIQCGRGARFLHEAALAFGVGDELGGQDLERDLAFEPGIERPIDDPHPATVDLAQDLEVRNALPRRQHRSNLDLSRHFDAAQVFQ